MLASSEISDANFRVGLQYLVDEWSDVAKKIAEIERQELLLKISTESYYQDHC